MVKKDELRLYDGSGLQRGIFVFLAVPVVVVKPVTILAAGALTPDRGVPDVCSLRFKNDFVIDQIHGFDSALDDLLFSENTL